MPLFCSMNNRDMSENVEKFTGRVAAYVEYRERYDPEVVLPLLRDWCGLRPEWTVADVGAGTGMLSDVFLAGGNRVIAVEPNAEMRQACAELHEGNPRLTLMDGTAEATGLEAASAEMVSVGRAFHWFDVEPAMQEFWRVLKPGGWVVVITFGRAEDRRDENVAYEELLVPYTARGLGTRVQYAKYERLKDFFAEGEFRHKEVPGEIQLGWDELRGLTLSRSHTPLPEAPEFGAFEEALRSYFARYEKNGRVTLDTRYWISAGRFGRRT
jgi:SAM-dependent methyltransferase